jgi:UDP-N-acetylmuramoyl-L-alanine---L-glutamate ligase
VIVVIGLGRETRELLGVLDRTLPGAAVLLLDERHPSADELPPCPNLALEVRGGADLDVVGVVPVEASAVYRSPGVSPYRAAVAHVVGRGVPVTTPTGYWAARRDNRDVVAITGTKGKSTTAALTAHLLAAAGRSVSLRGNIGRSALAADDVEPAAQDIVLELSSYQLADLDAPLGLGAITTLLRDHVPWHGSLERYHADKIRLLALSERTVVTPPVAAFLHAPGGPLAAGPRAGGGWPGEGAGGGADRAPAAGADELSVEMIDAVAASPMRAAVREQLARAGLLGEHLVDDAELALALVDIRLERPEGVGDLVQALADFRPLPHRLTPVGDHLGLRFVDDSISTVPESAVAAVRAYRARGPVTVLLGGDDRGQELAPLIELFRDPDVRAVLLPPLADRLHAALSPVAGARIQSATDLADAIDRAVAGTPPGGSVILSPAAPSFSSYRDFVARGEHFAALVAQLD